MISTIATMQKAHFKIGIVGAGTMGSGLAQLYAQAGFSVVLVETSPERLDQGMVRLHNSVEAAVKKALFSRHQAQQLLVRIHGALSLEALHDCSLVIEAVYEDLKTKQQIFKQLDALCTEKTLLATNTSSFRIADMSKKRLRHSLIGMHFFYPPAANRLLEVIGVDDLPAATRLLIDNVNAATGRVTVKCGDECGFVVNRFLVPWMNEAVRLVDEGVADMNAVERAAIGDFGTGIGPFTLMNWTGIAPVAHAMQTFHARFGAPYKPASGLLQQLQQNKPWPLAREGEIVVRPLSEAAATEISRRLQASVLLPCLQLLEKKVCTPEAIERGARVGLKWSKGPLQVWEELGQTEVDSRLRNYCKRHKKPLPARRQLDLKRIRARWQYISTAFHAGTQIICLNRPEALNALALPMLQQLEVCVATAIKSTRVKRIVLRGSGKTFAAGGDLTFLSRTLANGDFKLIESYFATAQRLFLKLDRSPKPVVALVEGMALGAGVQLALAADLIIATAQASFEFPETGLGLVPGLGGTRRLPQRIGKELAKYYIFTGERIDASTAMSIGLVDRIHDDIDWHDKVVELCTAIKLVQAERRDRTLPERLTQITALMNNKNISRLVQGKSINTLPPELQALHQQLKSKDLTALMQANALIDNNDKAFIQRELTALNKLTTLPAFALRLNSR